MTVCNAWLQLDPSGSLAPLGLAHESLIKLCPQSRRTELFARLPRVNNKTPKTTSVPNTKTLENKRCTSDKAEPVSKEEAEPVHQSTSSLHRRHREFDDASKRRPARLFPTVVGRAVATGMRIIKKRRDTITFFFLQSQDDGWTFF